MGKRKRSQTQQSNLITELHAGCDRVVGGGRKETEGAPGSEQSGSQQQQRLGPPSKQTKAPPSPLALDASGTFAPRSPSHSELARSHNIF